MVARQLIQIRVYHFSKSIKEQETMDEPRWSNCVGGGSGLCLAVKRCVRVYVCVRKRDRERERRRREGKNDFLFPSLRVGLLQSSGKQSAL